MYNYPITNHVARRIIVITLYYYIRSFKCAIILLYIKRRFRVIVCQSQWCIALRCFYDPEPRVLNRVYNSRRDRKHKDFSQLAVGDLVLKNDRSFVSPRSANSVHES